MTKATSLYSNFPSICLILNKNILALNEFMHFLSFTLNLLLKFIKSKSSMKKFLKFNGIIYIEIKHQKFDIVQTYSMKYLAIPVIALLITLSTTTNCGPGGIVCSSGECHHPRYIQGCYKYASESACDQCQFNYIKQGPICAYKPPQDNSDCCKNFSSKTGQCNLCAPGLTLDSGSCKDIRIIGCLQKSNGVCANCASDFQLINGKCAQRIPNCLYYNNDGSCSQCSEDSQFVLGSCVSKKVPTVCEYPFTTTQKGQCWVSGCVEVFQYGCKRCAEGFSLLPDGSCKYGQISGCSRYNNKGACVQCLKPFYSITENGFCVPIGCLKVNSDGICTECDKKKGFLLNNQKYCYIPNCLAADQDGCDVCARGYDECSSGCVPDKSVQICTICARGYHLGDNSKCIPNQPNCIKYSQTGKCSQCENGFYLGKNYKCLKMEVGCIYQNGVCSKCNSPFTYNSVAQSCQISACLSYNFDGCTKCKEGFFLTPEKLCNLPNCLKVQNQKCINCQQGFMLRRDGLCQQADPHCQNYDLSYKCIRCMKGYYMNINGICQQQAFGCNYVDGRCVSCRAPFTYNSQKEICQIDGCMDYFLGGCQRCDTGYDLRYNTCKLPNCLISYKGHCKQCDPDYIMKSDGTCVNKDEFCYKYNNQGQCIECAPKYFLSTKAKKCLQRQPGCLYNKNDDCYACQKPFYFDGTRCEIQGCLTLDFDGCKECRYPMELTKNKICQVVNCDRMENGKCVICKPGFSLAQDNSCRVSDPKCLIDGKKGCKKCVKGYKVDKRGVCQYADEHCWDFTEEGHCTNCDRLYFLNPYKKCQLKDSNCEAYSNGYCQSCKNLFYVHQGICYPNAKGCLIQKNIKECSKCQDGYSLEQGKCIPQITKLSYNSIDMDFDFFNGDTDQQKEQSKKIFTIGKDSKRNLDGAIEKGAKVFYSKGSKDINYQVDSEGSGWYLKGAIHEYIGIELANPQTFYALDIKNLEHNTLSKIGIQYSEDGINFKRIGQFKVQFQCLYSVETIYFTPVYAKKMRLVVEEGNPDIKIEFYYNSKRVGQYDIRDTNTYISKIIELTVNGKSQQIGLSAPTEDCVDKQLCWAGLQLCEPKKIYGFSLIPAENNSGSITEVYMDYSVDGVKFQCYNECKPMKVSDNKVSMPEALTATKLRVHFSKWEGKPNFGLQFNYKHY